ncbi:hypothetical protein BGX23_010228 [Mortierella sp. AD031]|nr:hypothetical protein BGX23_010228 [Mortierella sp. AD031]
MAAHNMCNVVRGHLLEQQRPLYLQPVDADGNYPWMQKDQNDSNQNKGKDAMEEAASTSSNKQSTSQDVQPTTNPARGSKRRRPAVGKDAMAEGSGARRRM